MSKKHPAFDYSRCVSCGICAQACSISCLTMTRSGKQGKYRNVFPELCNDSCTGCGICAKACPMEIIAVREDEP
jgi:NADH-quinone oxidoreductase subunit I